MLFRSVISAIDQSHEWVIEPEFTVTVWPDVMLVDEMMMSVPLDPTVRPETMTPPELFRNSARAAVPVAVAVAERGVPDRVSTPLVTVPVDALSVMVASTPVAPESALVPITREPATAVPVEAAAVLPETRSATSCIRFDLRVEE